MAQDPFRYFKTSPEIIKLGVIMYVRFPLSLCNVEDADEEQRCACDNWAALVCTQKSGPVFELVPAPIMELRHGQESQA